MERRYFNTEGCCYPDEHYMVSLDSRLNEIKNMVDAGKYFTINRGRQYGKTTTLSALEDLLLEDYDVVSIDFQDQMSSSKFENEEKFSKAFADAFLETLEFSECSRLCKTAREIPAEITDLVELFRWLSEICKKNTRKIVLIIDEVDQASNNQVFLDFLAQLRGYYLKRNKRPTFRSVILAGVHDIRNIRHKIRSDSEHRHNSPWNIAADFEVDMSFSADDIAGMLKDYENDCHTGMDISKISSLIYDYTSGYPVLVSLICRINDERLSDEIRWTKEGIVSAVGHIVSSKQPLFESLINKLEDDSSLKNCVRSILLNGDNSSYNPYNSSVDLAIMYGFIRVVNGNVQISNRIFETVIYNYFLTQDKMQTTPMYEAGSYDKTQNFGFLGIHQPYNGIGLTYFYLAKRRKIAVLQ